MEIPDHVLACVLSRRELTVVDVLAFIALTCKELRARRDEIWHNITHLNYSDTDLASRHDFSGPDGGFLKNLMVPRLPRSLLHLNLERCIWLEELPDLAVDTPNLKLLNCAKCTSMPADYIVERVPAECHVKLPSEVDYWFAPSQWNW